MIFSSCYKRLNDLIEEFMFVMFIQRIKEEKLRYLVVSANRTIYQWYINELVKTTEAAAFFFDCCYRRFVM